MAKHALLGLNNPQIAYAILRAEGFTHEQAEEEVTFDPVGNANDALELIKTYGIALTPMVLAGLTGVAYWQAQSRLLKGGESPVFTDRDPLKCAMQAVLYYKLKTAYVEIPDSLVFA